MTSDHRLTDDELSQLYSRLIELEQDRTWRRRCFFVRFLLGTGMKLSEAQHVRFRDVFLEFDPPVIFVQNLCQGSRPRYVQVLPEFAPILRRYIAKKGNPHPDHYLLPGRESGTCCERKTLGNYWCDVLKAAGIKHRPINSCVRSTVSVFTSEQLPQSGFSCDKTYQNLTTFPHSTEFRA